VDDVDRLVDIERHRRGRGGITGAVNIDHNAHHPHQFARRRCVLPAAHCRLARKADRRVGQLTDRQFEAGIVAQCVEVVGILIAAGDRQHPGLQDIPQIMDHTALIARVGNAIGQAPGNPHPTLRLSQQQHTAIGRQPPAIECRGHFLAANGWESKRNNAIVDHGGRGTFCPMSEGRVGNYSLHQISKLSYGSPTVNSPSHE
jgi:hypothetical protein